MCALHPGPACPQLAPYNSGYERLPAHMGLAGVRASPNQWDAPLALLPDHSKHHHAALHGEGQQPGSPMQAWQAAAMQREQQADAASVGPQGQQGQQPRSPQMHQQVDEPMELSQQAQQQQQSAAQQQQQQQSGCSPAPMSVAVAPVTPASPGGSGSGGSPGAGGHLTPDEAVPTSPVLGAPAAVSVLPPSKLMPFVVPFKGGPGSMCGGLQHSTWAFGGWVGWWWGGGWAGGRGGGG